MNGVNAEARGYGLLPVAREDGDTYRCGYKKAECAFLLAVSFCSTQISPASGDSFSVPADRAGHRWYATSGFLEASGGTVGAAIYSLALRTDRVYVHRLEICPPMRRHGYGLAFLSYLHRTYQLPIVPIDAPDVRPFWRAALKSATWEAFTKIAGMRGKP